jgi:hypothetical protein
MAKQVIAKEKCYIIISRGIYSSDKIIGAFQKKEDAECFVNTMNSQLTPEERQQWWYLIYETRMITDWRLENR